MSLLPLLRALAAVGLGLLASIASAGGGPMVPAPGSFGDATQSASADARYAIDWVTATGDNQNMPFAVVDKKGARLYVFDAGHHLLGVTPVLLGLGIGDRSVPGIGQRDPASLKPAERTTPAGRFVSEPGHNLKGEDIIWVDYDAKIAIHRLRADLPRQRRAARLASAGAQDKRISLGCVVVPVRFYEEVIRPVLGGRYGVVYVLPEDGRVENMFGAFQVSLGGP